MPRLADLSDDVRAYIAKAGDAGEAGEVPPESVLAALGVAIGNLRDEAKRARVSSGIEDTWRVCEDAYACIDDANRGEMVGGYRWSKSMSKEGPVTTDETPTPNDHSTLYVALTRRYVDAGTAKLGEILLAPGAKSFSIKPTPVPDLINAKDDKREVRMDQLPGAPVAMRDAQPNEIAALAPPTPGVAVPAPAGAPPSPAGAAGPPPQVPVTVSDLAKEAVDQADKAATKIEKRIYDWMVECRRSSQVRKVVFDSGRLGVGVLKGPFPRSSRQIATTKGDDGTIELKIVEKITPASKWVNAWNFFPDPSCGEDIHSGDHCFEREWMTERQVRKLKRLPGYMGAQIDKVIGQGPAKVNATDGSDGPSRDGEPKDQKGKYETWYFTGTLTREEMGCICGIADTPKLMQALKPDARQVHAIVTLINDIVVKATVNTLESGEFNYHAMPWQRRAGSWAGVGIAEQIQTPQAMVNAAVRSMLDNAGISAGGQIIMDTTLVTPADGDMGMSPHKIWYASGDGEVVDVNKAFGLFKIDNVTAELMQIVELGMRLGEESTSIPLITQGQSGTTTPETFGAAQLQNNNANQLLRSIGYLFDDCITEPEVTQYYEWAILDPDVPNDEKGDYNIDAHGSSALVEQAVQAQFTQQLLPLSLNAAYGLNPEKIMALVIEGNRLNPSNLTYTEEEKAKLPQTPAPAVQVAQIRAESDKAKLAAETAQGQAELAQAKDELHTEATIKLHDIKQAHESAYQLALLEYANKHQVTLEQVKAQLAKTAMELNTERELNAQNNAMKSGEPQRKPPRRQRSGQRPPVQAPGRAANGQAFTQVTQ